MGLEKIGTFMKQGKKEKERKKNERKKKGKKEKKSCGWQLFLEYTAEST